MEPIIDFFIEHDNSNSQTIINIRDVYKHFYTDIKNYKKIQFSTYTIENSTEYAEKYQKYRTISELIHLIFFWTIWGFGLSKLIMDISFRNPVSDLLLTEVLFLGFFGIIMIVVLFQFYSEAELYAKWIKRINEKNFFQYSREQFDALLVKDDFNENEKNKILKTFINADKKYLSTPNPDSSFSASLLYTMIDFENKNSNWGE